MKQNAYSTPLSYNAPSDRLIGDNFFQEINNRYVLNCLMSLRRAKMLYETGTAFAKAYEALPTDPSSSVTPIGVPVAVLELNSYVVDKRNETVKITIDELFNIPQLSSVPLEYRQLCQMVTLVPGTTSIQESPVTDAQGVRRFGRQLLRTLSCAHRHANAAFTRSTGTCLDAQNLTPLGEIIDIYYLTRASEAKQHLAEFQRLDLTYALLFVWWLSNEDCQLLTEAYRQAASLYVGQAAGPKGLFKLADQTSAQICQLSAQDPNLDPFIEKFAAALYGK